MERCFQTAHLPQGLLGDGAAAELGEAHEIELEAHEQRGVAHKRGEGEHYRPHRNHQAHDANLAVLTRQIYENGKK